MSRASSSPDTSRRAGDVRLPARRSRTSRRTRRRARPRPPPPGSTCPVHGRRGPRRRSAAPQAPRSGARARRSRSRSPSCVTTVAVPLERVSDATRVIVARLRISAVAGMSSSSASHTCGEVRCSLRSASRGRPYSRTSSAVWLAVAAACARVKPSTMRGRPSAVPPRRSTEQALVLRRDVERRVARLTACAGWARRSRSRCVTPSRWRYLTAWWASASTGLSAYQRPTARRSAAPAAEALDEVGELEQVRARATCGSASSAAFRVASSPRPAAIASANSAGSFFGARPRR